MTDAEKLAEYDRLVELLNERIALEQHVCNTKNDFDAIQFVRAEAYRDVVELIFGGHVLPGDN
jgi:hypothetical protein